VINVVCVSDAGYVPHLAAMLLSLAEHVTQERVQVFVCFEGASSDKQQIVRMLQKYPVDLRFIPLESVVFDNLPQIKIGHASSATYVRLLIDKLLPEGIERLIYLDVDLIVRSDLSKLWHQDLNGKTIAAVRDAIPYSRHSVLGLPAGAPYFNAGVMLIDLVRWRLKQIGARALNFACEDPDSLFCWDQCALNFILYEDWTPLDNTWNYQTMEVARYRNHGVYFTKMDQRTRKAVQIVHFTGDVKPWQYLNYHPLKREYLGYRQRTPWPLVKFDDRGARNIVRRFLHRRLPLLVPFAQRLGDFIPVQRQ